MVLISVGVLTAAFAAWQGWGQTAVAVGSQQSSAARQVKRWEFTARPSTVPAGSPTIPVSVAPAAGGTVAVVRIPRFGASWQRVIRQGVGEDVLDSFTAGVGHYPGTGMPGARGNFAIAAHDTGWGDAFRQLGHLRIGDRIVVQTKTGWYVYAFRNFEWVQPETVQVLDAVPQQRTVDATARLITLTTCDPPYHAQERMVAYGSLVGFASTRAAAGRL